MNKFNKRSGLIKKEDWALHSFEYYIINNESFNNHTICTITYKDFKLGGYNIDHNFSDRHRTKTNTFYKFKKDKQ